MISRSADGNTDTTLVAINADGSAALAGTVTLGGTAASVVVSGAGAGATANQTSTADIRAGTTKANVGLGSVDNTSDAAQTTATLSEADSDDVGLGSVTNANPQGQAQAPQTPLPETPGVNPALVKQVLPSSNTMETGLTPTEQALLSNEEKGIRLRQRGMTA